MLPQRWADIPLVNIFTWIPVLRKADEKNNWKQRRLPAIKKPRKGDIIVFRNIENKHELLVKRVVDIIPKGTTIRLDSSNYEMVRKIAGLERSGKMTHIYSVLNNYYFVVGDNRQNSHDSRSFGYIPESTIVGKINMALYSPLAKSQPDSSGIKRCRLFKWIQ